MSPLEQFAGAVARRRRELRLTRRDVVERSGISYTVIERLEQQKGYASTPERPTVISLAVALETDPDEWLALFDDYEPLSPAEREHVEERIRRITERMLGKAWDELQARLTPDQQRKVIDLIYAFLAPGKLPQIPSERVTDKGIRGVRGAGEIPGQRDD